MVLMKTSTEENIFEDMHGHTFIKEIGVSFKFS